MDNPYQPPLPALAHRGPAHAPFRPTRRELIFLAAVTSISLGSHRWYHEIHGLFNVHSAVSGFVLEALALGAVGCWLATRGHRLSAARSVLGLTAGAALAGATALTCCWGLIVAGQPPRALVVPVSVLAGMVTTASMVARTSDRWSAGLRGESSQAHAGRISETSA